MPSAPLSVRTRWLGAGVVLAGVLFQALWLGLPAILFSVGLVTSCGLWVGSSWRFTPQLKVVFCIAVLVFLVHAAEEFLTASTRTSLPRDGTLADPVVLCGRLRVCAEGTRERAGWRAGMMATHTLNNPGSTCVNKIKLYLCRAGPRGV